MSYSHNVPSFVFIIDTEQYAGNFDRQMCAYLTGIYGECGVGKGLAEEFLAQEGMETLRLFEEHVDNAPDNHGTLRPTSIWPTPGWFNNGHGGSFKDDGQHEEEAQAHFNNAVQRHADDLLRTYSHMPSYAWQERKRYLKENEGKKFKKWPAYQSVAIFFHKRPPDELIAIMKRRVEDFVYYMKTRMWPTYITVTGFRLIEQKVVQTEEVM